MGEYGQLFMDIDINVLAFFFLSIVPGLILFSKNRWESTTRLFLFLSLSMILIVLMDTAFIVLDSFSSQLNLKVYRAFLVVYFCLNPLPVALWVSYFDYQLHENMQRLKFRGFYMFPLLVMVLLFLLLPQDVFFVLDKAGHYQRGIAIWLVTGLNFILVSLSFLFAFLNKGSGDPIMKSLMGFFNLIPMTAAVIQILFPGIRVIWASAAFATILVFVLVENQSESRDYLTGLFSRRQMDLWIQHRIKTFNKNGSFALVLLDLDHFKTINDEFGHKEGDKALLDFSRLMMRSVKPQDVVIRYGGDEFVILLETEDPVVVELILDRIDRRILEENLRRNKAYNLEFSAGFIMYHPDTFESAKEMIHQADLNMYAEKVKNRRTFQFQA